MGLSLRNIGKKIGDVLGGAERQVNPFDHGATYSNPTPAPAPVVQRTPAPLFMQHQQYNPVTHQAMPNTPYSVPYRKDLNAVGIGLERSGVGTLQGITGAVDLLTPGKGTNRFSKTLDKKAKGLDQTVKNRGLDSSLYKLGQFGGDAAQMLTGGEIAKGAEVVATKAAPKVMRYVPKVISKAAEVKAKALEEGGHDVAAATIRAANSTANQANIAAQSGLDVGSQSGKGHKVTPKDIAKEIAMNEAMGIGLPAALKQGERTAQDVKSGKIRAGGSVIGEKAAASVRNDPTNAIPFTDPNTGRKLWEIDDSKVKFKDSYNGYDHMSRGSMPLGDIIDHPTLFKAYPQMKKMPVRFDENMDPNISAEYTGSEIKLNQNRPESPEETIASLLHEGTHHVQNIEGLPDGGSASAGRMGRDEVSQQLAEAQSRPKVQDFLTRSKGMVDEAKAQGLSRNDVNRALKALEKTGGSEVKQFLDLARKNKALKGLDDFALYHRLHGEVMARNVENRMDFNMDQRRQLPFNETADYRPEDVITEHEDAKNRAQQQYNDMVAQEEADTSYKMSAPEEPTEPVDRPNSDSLWGNFKKGFVESDTPILDAMKAVDKKMGTGTNGDHLSRYDRFYYNSNMQRSSHALANQFFESSPNIERAFSGLDEKSRAEFDQYASARTELASAKGRGKSFKTSRPVDELQKIVDGASPEFRERFTALNQHYKDLVDHLTAAGVIDKKKAAQFKSNNDYVRLQRDMGDLVQRFPTQGNSVGLRSTVTGQKRRGSSRNVQPAGETAAWYTQQVFREARKNITGRQTVDALKEGGLAKRVTSNKAQHANVIAVRRNGKQEFWEVPADVKETAMNINPVQLGPVMRIISAPGRLARAGITGLNPVFIARNVVKDQADSAVNSQELAHTHNPVVFFEGLLNAGGDALGVNHSEAYQGFLRHVGETTSYDFTRNQKNATEVIDRVAGGKKAGVAQGFKHPVRSLENLASVTERSTRFQNYIGAYRQGIKKGLTPEQASEYGAIQAWRNSVDFARAGQYGRFLNSVIPYWNPATQGARQMVRNFRLHPVKGTVKSVAFVGLPIVAATAWNLHDDETAQVYKNIPDYEKEGNIIIIPPGTKQKADGSYDVIKIPLPPGIGNLFQPMRRALESYHDKTPIDAKKVATDILGSVSGPVNFQNGVGGFAGSFTPQWGKPAVQGWANQDLFSGKQTVPDYMTNAKDANGNPIKPEQMTYQQKGPDGKLSPRGSGTAQQVADKLHVSPLKVEKFIKDTGGTVGEELLNAADNAQAKIGTIAKTRIGGQSIPAGFKKSFASAQGIDNNNKSDGAKYYDAVTAATNKLNDTEKAAYAALHPSKSNFLGDVTYEKDAAYNPAARIDIYNRFPKVFEADKSLDAMQRAEGKAGNPLFDLNTEQRKKILEKQELPPGATDPELSNLYTQDWYQNYQAANTKYFDSVDKELKKSGGSGLGDAKNPYPTTPKDVQSVMDTYTALPKGTGARSTWIKNNPDEWTAMQDQYAKIDDWQNKQRAARGLAPKDNVATTSGSSSGGTGGSSSGSKYSSSGSYGSSGLTSSQLRLGNSGEFMVSVSQNGGKAKIAKASGAKKIVGRKKSVGKVQVSFKKARTKARA